MTTNELGLKETITESITARKAAPAVTISASWINWLSGLIAVTEEAPARAALNRELTNWFDYDQKGWFI